MARKRDQFDEARELALSKRERFYQGRVCVKDKTQKRYSKSGHCVECLTSGQRNRHRKKNGPKIHYIKHFNGYQVIHEERAI